MSIYSLKETPDDDVYLDDPLFQDMQAEIKSLEEELQILQEENSWLRFTLERKGIDPDYIEKSWRRKAA